MGEHLIGVAAMGGDALSVLSKIRDLEARNIPAAWLTTGGAGLDALSLFSAAAVQTKRIKLGTSIIPTWPRHPVAIAQQLQVLGQLAPGRFRFGTGPSHKPMMERGFGADFRKPLTNLREYMTIVRTLLAEGKVDFEGEHYRAHASVPHQLPDLPIMASALRAASFELCGEISDGAISWVCPMAHLRDVGLPALARGAAKAGRPVPPLIVHVPLCIHDDEDVARKAVKAQFGRYAQIPFYAAMFVAAGFPEAREGSWSDGMVDAVAVIGDESAAETALAAIFAWGAGEILVSVVPAGDDLVASEERILKFVSGIAS